MRQTIYVTSDHGGWSRKNDLVAWLGKTGYRVVDIGPLTRQPNDDYPVWAAQASRLVIRDNGSRSIMLCRSGVGMAIVANKIPGIRAVQGWSPAVARRSRQDEDTNVLSLASDQQSWKNIQTVVRAWLTTSFQPKKNYQRRLRQIQRIEQVVR